MKHSSDTFLSQDQIILYEQFWECDAPKGAIALVHGIAEHSDRYVHIAEAFTQAGFNFYTFDLRGHGKSDGDRCYTPSFNHYLADVDIFLERVRSRTNAFPLFLMGHSMGGAIATLYCITRQVKESQLQGLILSAALLKSREVSPILLQIAFFLGRLFPKQQSFVRLSGQSISRDQQVVDAYQNDEKVYHARMPFRTLCELLRATQRIETNLEQVTVPFLAMHGTADTLTDPAGSKELYQRSPIADKTLQLYDGLFHEILNEPEHEQVMADVVAWVQTRIPRV
jgi:acylglycerol lipase